MMTTTRQMPALSVTGTPTKRSAILELALGTSLAHVTSTISFWTSIYPLYYAQAFEVAVTSGHIHEVSGGRFRLGLGVSHERAMSRLGINTGKPLHDTAEYVASIRDA